MQDRQTEVSQEYLYALERKTKFRENSLELLHINYPENRDYWDLSCAMAEIPLELWLTNFPEQSISLLLRKKVDVNLAKRFIGGVTYAFDAIEHGDQFRQRQYGILEYPNKFDPMEYITNCISVYESCGRLVARSFSHVYGEIIQQGISPNQFVELAQDATLKGGKRVAQRVVYQIPDAIKADIDPKDFIEASAIIYEEIKSKSSRRVHTMKEVHSVLLRLVRNGSTINEATQDILGVVNRSSRDNSYWAIRVLPWLKDEGSDYGKENFLQDIAFLEQSTTPIAVKWFSYTIEGALRGKYRLKHAIESLQDLPKDEDRKVYLEELRQADQVLNIDQIRLDYKRLFDQYGQQTATMYSMIINRLFYHGIEANEVATLLLLPNTIDRIKKSLPAKVFRSFLWNFPKLSQPISKLEFFADSLIEIYNSEGETRALERLAYTAASRRKGAYILGIMDPQDKNLNVYKIERDTEEDLEQEVEEIEKASTPTEQTFSYEDNNVPF